MSKKKYFHELSQDEFDSLFDQELTWGEIAEKYEQPDWCHYSRALLGVAGCNTLLCSDKDIRSKISYEYCKTCDCHKDHDDPC